MTHLLRRGQHASTGRLQGEALDLADLHALGAAAEAAPQPATTSSSPGSTPLPATSRAGVGPTRLRAAWTLRSPASKVLRRVPGNPAVTRAVFVADQPGTAQLILVKRLGCYPPLRWPVAAPTGSESERMRPPLNEVTVPITVRVR